VLLKNALEQFGPWRGETLNIDRNWLVNTLGEKISSVNWKDASTDIERFLNPIEQKTLNLWSEKFFMNKLKKLDELLKQ
jgi:hypothetical protein